MTNLLALAARVEQLTGPCRETDALIAMVAIKGASSICREFDPPKIVLSEGPWICDAPKYTASLDAAMTLARDDCTFALGDCNEDDVPWACVTDADGVDYAATGASPILAFLSANLKARSAANV